MRTRLVRRPSSVSPKTSLHSSPERTLALQLQGTRRRVPDRRRTRCGCLGLAGSSCCLWILLHGRCHLPTPCAPGPGENGKKRGGKATTKNGADTAYIGDSCWVAGWTTAAQRSRSPEVAVSGGRLEAGRIDRAWMTRRSTRRPLCHRPTFPAWSHGLIGAQL